MVAETIQNEIIYSERYQNFSASKSSFPFRKHRRYEIKRRKRFRYERSSSISEEHVRLCSQCSNYLAIKDKKLRRKKHMASIVLVNFE